MKKFLAVMAIVMFVFAGTASATYTNLMSKGGMPVELTDLDLIMMTYPSQINNFNNLAVVEYGFGLWGYMTIDAGPGVLGLMASESPGIEGVDPNVSYDSPNNILNISYGMDLGDGLLAGIALTYGSESDSFEDVDGEDTLDYTNTSDNESLLGVDLGVTADVGMPLDVALSFAMPSQYDESITYNSDDEKIDEDVTSASGMDLGLSARTMIDSWILNLGFTMSSIKVEQTTWTDANEDGDAEDAGDTNTIQTNEDSDMDVNLLVGYNVAASDTMKFTIGSGLQYASDVSYTQITEDKIADTKVYNNSNDDSMTDISIPLYISVDCNINDTYSFTGGVSKRIMLMENDTENTVDADNEVTDEDSDTGLDMESGLNGALGVTGQYGDVKVQWLLNIGMLLNGPYLISGIPSNLSSNIALVYEW